MARDNRQIEDEFSAASQEVSAGRSIGAVLEEYPGYAAELEPMLRLVEVIKEVPPPVLSSDAMARIEKRAQVAAKAQLAATHAGLKLANLPGAQPRPFSIVRSASDTAATPLRHQGRIRLALGRIPRITGAGTRLVFASVALLAVLVLATVGFLALQPGTPGKSTQQIESYSGIITSIEPGKWMVDDDTEVFIDNLTEIHGQPAVGANMTCIAERLEGHERYRALEVWVLDDSEPPAQPTIPEGQSTSWQFAGN
jgi:hypothetical protein